MVPPALHRVFTACGIRDASATIEGSRNQVEVVKCAIQMLHGGVSRFSPYPVLAVYMSIRAMSDGAFKLARTDITGQPARVRLGPRRQGQERGQGPGHAQQGRD